MPRRLSLISIRKKTLWIDPGMSGTGWVVTVPPDGDHLRGKLIVCDMGRCVPRDIMRKQKIPDPMPRRIESLRVGMLEVFLMGDVEQMVIEEPSFWDSKSGRASARRGNLLLLFSAYATMINLAIEFKVPMVISLPVAEWKGQTRKRMTLRRLQRLIDEDKLWFCFEDRKPMRGKNLALVRLDPPIAKELLSAHISDALGMAARAHREVLNEQ